MNPLDADGGGLVGRSDRANIVLAVAWRLLLGLRRLAIGADAVPLRRIWSLLYGAAARVLGIALRLGAPGASVYVRGSLAAGEIRPGWSDVDVAVIAESGEAARAVRERWRGMTDRAPALARAVDLAIYDEDELAAACASPTFVAQEPVHLALEAPADEAGLRLRPGLAGPTGDWRLVQGRERLRPDGHEARTRPVVAWLELQSVWRSAFRASAEPDALDLPYVCVKLVADAARIWLWLVRGDLCMTRREALAKGLDALPEEEPALRAALALDARLRRNPAPDVASALSGLVRLSSRLAAHVGAAAGDGGTAVAVEWDPAEPLALHAGARAPRLVPLADWRARVWPVSPDEALAPADFDPTDPAALGDAVRAAGGWGPYPAVVRDGMLLIAGPGLLRAVQCPLSDPVSFALLEGRTEAWFPDVPGWSADDSARRAVAEHRAWLASGDMDLERFGRLFTAAQAALFAESLASGAPRLPLTMAAAAAAIGAEDEYLHYRAWRAGEAAASAEIASSLRERLLAFDAYAQGTP